MSTTSVGRNAEEHVAAMLRNKGHSILSKNWRNRWCEIDIISSYKNTVYFTEVKYRASSVWGSGLEYISSKKLRQMHFAAEFWIAENKWRYDACLLAAEVNAEGMITLVEL